MNGKISRALEEQDRVISKNHHKKRTDTTQCINHRQDPRTRSRSPIAGASAAPATTDDEFTTVTYKRRPRTTSNASNVSRMSTTNITTAKITTIHIKNIPEKYHHQKTMAQLLKQLRLNINQAIVYGTHQMKILSEDPNINESIKQLQNLIGEPLKFEAPRHTSETTSDETPRQGPNFSCVMRGYSTDLDIEDILTEATEQGIDIIKAWRIKSRATNKDTTLVRLITPSTSSLNRLLQDGFTIFWRKYQVEESHPPKPPMQCTKCQKYHHSAASCPESSITCPKCAGNHPAHKCTATERKCANCEGNHASWTHKCPERPAEPDTETNAAPIRCVSDNDDEEKETVITDFALTNNVIRMFTTTLLNLFPSRVKDIHREIKSQCKKQLNRKVKFSHSGSKLHLSIRCI